MIRENWLRFCIIFIACITFSCQSHPHSAPEHEAEETKDAILEFVQDLSRDKDWQSALGFSSSSEPFEESLLKESLSACNNPYLAELYDLSKNNAVLLQPKNDKSTEALNILQSIESHGSDFKPPQMAEILALMEKRLSLADENPEPLEIKEDDITVLTKNLRENAFDLTQVEPKKALMEALLSADCDKYWPRYCELHRQWISSHSQEIKLQTQLDVLMTCALTSWAQVLRLDYPQNTYKFDRWKNELDETSIKRMRLRLFFKDLLRHGPRHAFARIEPSPVQYKKLRNARKIYTDAIAAGGWQTLNVPSSFKEGRLGHSYPFIPDLRKRLAQENYPIKDLESDIYDEDLQAAVDLYRELHQLSPKNHLDKVFFRNITVSPQERLKSIDLSLQRYRESPLGELDYYIFVNIPDFHAELWRANQRLHRFRVIIGNNQMQKDPLTNKPVRDPETKEIIHPNRTPIMSAKMNEIIYNPYWNVPVRIRVEELEPKLAENPNYYIENNFEEVNVDNPRLYYVRELPNPKNSLGRVKFMFPNPHDVYLHDTPAKSIFKNPVRAYSHGCIRVQDPLDLAELILKEDGTWDESAVNQVLNKEPLEQTSFFLKTPFDVVIEYFDARVDDSGVVAFLSDVYGYDAMRKK